MAIREGYPVFSKRFWFVSLAMVVSFAFVGCHEEEKITRAVRPRVNEMKRVLGAIVPPEDKRGDKEQKTWVFKVIGSDSEVEPLVDPFNDFIHSVEFDGDQPKWKLPEGWTEERAKEDGLRFTTIHTGPKGKSPDVSVTAITGEVAASIGENVDRWRVKDLGYNTFRDRRGNPDVDDFYRYISIANNRLAVLVDMTGPGPRDNAAAMRAPAPDREPFKYTLPEGWSKAPPKQFSILSFVAADKENKADITVTAAGGTMLSNVNRWRNQLQLGPMTAEQVKALPEAAIASTKGILVDITGPAAPPQANRIVGVIVQQGDQSLFFKMTGPAEFVGKQKPAFENFLKSIQLGG